MRPDWPGPHVHGLFEKVTEAWIAEMKSKGIDGQALVNDVRALVAKYAGPAD